MTAPIINKTLPKGAIKPEINPPVNTNNHAGKLLRNRLKKLPHSKAEENVSFTAKFAIAIGCKNAMNKLNATIIRLPKIIKTTAMIPMLLLLSIINRGIDITPATIMIGSE